MKRLSQTTQFARDVKRMRKRGKDLGKLQDVVGLLAHGVALPPEAQGSPAHRPVGAVARLPCRTGLGPDLHNRLGVAATGAYRYALRPVQEMIGANDRRQRAAAPPLLRSVRRFVSIGSRRNNEKGNRMRPERHIP
jgi:hypothetical protein